jgi:hypothetical protein
MSTLHGIEETMIMDAKKLNQHLYSMLALNHTLSRRKYEAMRKIQSIDLPPSLCAMLYNNERSVKIEKDKNKAAFLPNYSKGISI